MLSILRTRYIFPDGEGSVKSRFRFREVHFLVDQLQGPSGSKSFGAALLHMKDASAEVTLLLWLQVSQVLADT